MVKGMLESFPGFPAGADPSPQYHETNDTTVQCYCASLEKLRDYSCRLMGCQRVNNKMISLLSLKTATKNLMGALCALDGASFHPKVRVLGLSWFGHELGKENQVLKLCTLKRRTFYHLLLSRGRLWPTRGVTGGRLIAWFGLRCS